MDRSTAVGEYLRARRALVAPESVGFVADRARKVDGLRREEVAVLAGISPEYYLRLEQGRDHQPSDQVLRALAGALQLDQHGVAYLERLVHPPTADRPAPVAPDAGERLGDLLAQWRDVPAVVFDANLDVVASNSVADELGQPAFGVGSNRLVSMFEDPDARSWADDWETRARELVGAFRLGGDPDDRRFREVVGDLSLRSEDFRRIWRRQDVGVLVDGCVDLAVPPFGRVPFAWHDFAVAGFPGHTLTTLHPVPGTSAPAVLAYCAARATQRRPARA